MQEKWSNTCYSCKVVARLIDAFMNGAAFLYDATAEAGVKLLVFGFIIWLPFWGLKHLASMGGANGSAMLMELAVMLFKIGCAYIVVCAGISTLSGYFLTPILDTGADYALAILNVNDPIGGVVVLSEGEGVTISGGAISADLLNKILLLAKTASNKLSSMMVIGSALFSFGFEHPLNTIPIPINVPPGLLWIPDFLSIITGIAIWCVGLFVSFSVCFYLLDVSFRLGFAVLLLPIAIGLWPFPLEDAKKKVGTCVAIAINAAGLFVILATTSVFALVLLDNAFGAINDDPSGSGGINKLFESLDDADYGITDAAKDTIKGAGKAVKELFNKAQVTIGPFIENGFYYDFWLDKPFTTEDFVKIENKMHEIIKRDEKVIRKVVDRKQAIAIFEDLGEHYKVEIINDLPEDAEISLYYQGDYVDLCRGPHVPSLGKIGDAFKIMKTAGAYWRGNSNNEMLQRLYATAWADKKDLKAYLLCLEEAEKRDHRKIAKEMDLFHFEPEYAQGGVFWHDKDIKFIVNSLNICVIVKTIMDMKKSKLHVLWIDAYGKLLDTGKNMVNIITLDKQKMKKCFVLNR